MATKTVTIDTGEWIYLDKFGDEHVVTNGQTFTFTLTDGGAAAVNYAIDQAQSITTTDGLVITMRPEVDGGMTARKTEPLKDAQDAATSYDLSGEWVIECPVSGEKQRWRIAKMQANDVDAPTALSDMRLEDQFGNVMNLPSTGAGWTVA